MNRRWLIIGALVGFCILVVVLVAFLGVGKPPTVPITYYGGKNTQAILYIDDRQIYTVEKFNIVVLDRQNKVGPKTLLENIKSYNSSQAQQRVFSTVFDQNSKINGNVTTFADGKTTQLKDVVGIIWFSSPLYARLSQGTGLSRTDVVTTSGQIVLSGQPYDDLAGFADRYITYSLGEGGNPRKTDIYDTQAKKVVKEVNLAASDPTPRDYKDFLIYQSSNTTKALDANLNEINLTGIKKLSNLSINVTDSSVYGLDMQKAGSGTEVKLKKFNINTKQSETLTTFLQADTSPLQYDAELGGMWYEEATGQLFVVINSQIYLIRLQASWRRFCLP